MSPALQMGCLTRLEHQARSSSLPTGSKEILHKFTYPLGVPFASSGSSESQLDRPGGEEGGGADREGERQDLLVICLRNRRSPGA